MKKILILITCIFVLSVGYGQKFEYWLSTGSTIINPVENLTTRFENSLVYCPRPKTKLYVMYAFGSGPTEELSRYTYLRDVQTRYKEWSINASYAPFKEEWKAISGISFGTGLYYLDYVYVDSLSSTLMKDVFTSSASLVHDFEVKRQETFGVGISIESMSKGSFISERVVFGFRFSSQYYLSGTINNSLVVRAGFKL